MSSMTEPEVRACIDAYVQEARNIIKSHVSIKGHNLSSIMHEIPLTHFDISMNRNFIINAIDEVESENVTVARLAGTFQWLFMWHEATNEIQ